MPPIPPLSPAKSKQFDNAMPPVAAEQIAGSAFGREIVNVRNTTAAPGAPNVSHATPQQSSMRLPDAQETAEIAALIDARRGFPGAVDLVGYLHARASAGQPIQGTLLKRLIIANQHVNRTRAALSLGRGNVIGDIMGHPTAYLQRRIAFIRSELLMDLFPGAKDKLIRPVLSAKAEFMKAGNCEEMASHVACAYVPDLKDDEQIVVVTSSEADHEWVELRTQNGPTIVMDAWANGPAILKEDSPYLSYETHEDEPYGRESVDILMQMMTYAKRELCTNAAAYMRQWDRVKWTSAGPTLIRAEQSVVANRMLRAATAADIDCTQAIARDLGAPPERIVQLRDVLEQGRERFRNHYLGSWTSL